jgi:hypothetical protein
MLKKIKLSFVALTVISIGLFSSEILVAQEGGPATGTCCKTNSGAICVVAGVPFDNRFYKTEGDCDPFVGECWVGDEDCEINAQD